MLVPILKKEILVRLATYLFLISPGAMFAYSSTLIVSGEVISSNLYFVKWWYYLLGSIVFGITILGYFLKWWIRLWQILKSWRSRRKLQRLQGVHSLLESVSGEEVRRLFNISGALEEESVNYINYRHLYAHKRIHTAKFIETKEPEADRIFRKILVELAHKANVRGAEAFSYNDNYSNAIITELLCDMTKLPWVKVTTDGVLTKLSPNKKIVVIESILINDFPLQEHISYLQEEKAEIVGIIILFDGSPQKIIDLSAYHIKNEQIIRAVEVDLEFHGQRDPNARAISYKQL